VKELEVLGMVGMVELRDYKQIWETSTRVCVLFFSQGGSKCVAIFCGVLERKAVYNWHNSWRTPSKHLK